VAGTSVLKAAASGWRAVGDYSIYIYIYIYTVDSIPPVVLSCSIYTFTAALSIAMTLQHKRDVNRNSSPPGGTHCSISVYNLYVKLSPQSLKPAERSKDRRRVEPAEPE
jgi:hypothetical protein